MNDCFNQAFKVLWNPQPNAPPKVDPHLSLLNGPQRMMESICFFVLTCEYWVSRDGVLREWLRITGRLGLLIASPIAIIMPTITFGLWQMVLWTEYLVRIFKNLVLLPLAALVAITLVGVLVIVLRSSVRMLGGH